MLARKVTNDSRALDNGLGCVMKIEEAFLESFVSSQALSQKDARVHSQRQSHEYDEYVVHLDLDHTDQWPQPNRTRCWLIYSTAPEQRLTLECSQHLLFCHGSHVWDTGDEPETRNQ